MKDEDLDRIFRGEDIAPSRGFVPSVMRAVRRDAATPAPMEFPWARALPGFVALLTAVALCIALLVRAALAPHSPSASASTIIEFLGAAKLFGGGWIAFALLVTLASLTFSLRTTTIRL